MSTKELTKLGNAVVTGVVRRTRHSRRSQRFRFDPGGCTELRKEWSSRRQQLGPVEMATFEERYREFEDLSVATFERELPATLGDCTGRVERRRLIVDATRAAPAHHNPRPTPRTSHARAGNALFHSRIIRRATRQFRPEFNFIH